MRPHFTFVNERDLFDTLSLFLLLKVTLFITHETNSTIPTIEVCMVHYRNYHTISYDINIYGWLNYLPEVFKDE
jgi:hypothetical protein